MRDAAHLSLVRRRWQERGGPQREERSRWLKELYDEKVKEMKLLTKEVAATEGSSRKSSDAILRTTQGNKTSGRLRN